MKINMNFYHKKKILLAMLGLLAIITGTMIWYRTTEKEEQKNIRQAFSVSGYKVKAVEKPSIIPLFGNVEGLTSC